MKTTNLLVVVAVLSLLSCGTPPAETCTPGATQTCVGAGACQGGQSCLPDGSGFGDCACSSAPGTGGSSGGTGGMLGTGGSAAVGGNLDSGSLDSGSSSCPNNCDDSNACTNDKCTTAGCTHTAVPDSTKCDDGNACTQGDYCRAGSCVGGAINCDDGNACTADSCVAKACVHTDAANGAVCSSTGQTCQNGACQCATGVIEICNDGIDNNCDGKTDCEDPMCNAKACNNAPDVCHAAGVCSNNTCVNVPKPGTICNDGDGCTDNDVCSDIGACHGTPKVCPGSADECHNAPVCTNGTCGAAVKVGAACTSNTDKCLLTPVCDSAGACTQSSTGTVLCSGVLTNNTLGFCGPNTCNPNNGICAPIYKTAGTLCPMYPSDGGAVTGLGVCTGSSTSCAVCTPGAACTPSNSCNQGTISCTSGTPTCIDNGLHVPDGTKSCIPAVVNLCVTGASCVQGTCTANTSPVAKPNPIDTCHAISATCNPATGWQQINAPDGTACVFQANGTGQDGVCSAGVCTNGNVWQPCTMSASMTRVCGGYGAVCPKSAPWICQPCGGKLQGCCSSPTTTATQCNGSGCCGGAIGEDGGSIACQGWTCW